MREKFHHTHWSHLTGSGNVASSKVAVTPARTWNNSLTLIFSSSFICGLFCLYNILAGGILILIFEISLILHRPTEEIHCIFFSYIFLFLAHFITAQHTQQHRPRPSNVKPDSNFSFYSLYVIFFFLQFFIKNISFNFSLSSPFAPCSEESLERPRATRETLKTNVSGPIWDVKFYIKEKKRRKEKYYPSSTSDCVDSNVSWAYGSSSFSWDGAKWDGEERKIFFWNSRKEKVT